MSFENVNFKWMIFTSLTVLAYATGVYLGGFQLLLKVDTFYLTFFNIALYALSTIYLGYSQIMKKTPNYGGVWFVTDALQFIGLIGTVAGMILMFNIFYGDVDMTDPVKMKALISEIAQSTSVALYTTFSGLLNSLFLKTQLMVLQDEETA